MKYDFTSIMNRHGKDAIAVDSVGQMNGFAPEAPKPGFDVIPMWVADMNFPTVPTIQQAIIERAQHPAFGYFSATDEYYDSIIRWHQTRNGVTGLTKECIGYENGVLGGVISALTSFAAPGDAVLLHSPTYIGFTASVENNGYKIVHSPLVKDENGVWRMDFEDMDAKIKANHIHVAIFCSPHNPCGRVWERWELEKAMEVYRANDCLVISDEIWSDIILNGHKHIPTQSVSEDARSRTVALYAPSKTFNLAGLMHSNIIIRDAEERARFQDRDKNIGAVNPLSIAAHKAAYEHGGSWLEQLKAYVDGNLALVDQFLKENIPGAKFTIPESTYFAWVDLREVLPEVEDLPDFFANKAGVLLEGGDGLFVGNARGHIRLNLAMPRATVQIGLARIAEAIRKEKAGA